MLEELRNKARIQGIATSTIAGSLSSLAGAAGAGALKGLAAGPKGAIAGGVVGVSLNLTELARRRWTNENTEKTLQFIDEVIDLFQQVCEARLSPHDVLNKMVGLKCACEHVGPAARRQ